MKEKLLCCSLFILFLFFSSYQKKQVAQTPIENPINQVQENLEEHYLPPGFEPETVEEDTPHHKDITFSSPDLSLSYKKYFIKNEDEYINGKKNYFFIPLQIRNNQFEYCIDQNLVRFNLKTKKEKVYKDVFQGLSIYAPLHNSGEWIYATQNQYFYTESITDGDLETMYFVCKDTEALKTIWKTKLFQVDRYQTMYLTNKIKHNDKYLFVAFKEGFRSYCIEMASGKIQWEFNPLTLYPNLEKGYTSDSESQKMYHSFSIAHIFSKGVVFEMHDHVDNKDSKIFNNDTFDMNFVLNMEGKLINQIKSSDALMFNEDSYIYANGCKSLLNNKILWQTTTTFENSYVYSEYDKQILFFSEKTPNIYLTNEFPFFTNSEIQNNNNTSVFDLRTGKEVWKNEIEAANLICVTEKDSKFYSLIEQNKKYFLFIYDTITQKKITLPVSSFSDLSKFFTEPIIYTKNDCLYFICPEGLLTINKNTKVNYQPFLLKSEVNNFLIKSNFNVPYYFSNATCFVIAYTPEEATRGISRGGGFIVLEKK